MARNKSDTIKMSLVINRGDYEVLGKVSKSLTMSRSELIRNVLFMYLDDKRNQFMNEDTLNEIRDILSGD